MYLTTASGKAGAEKQVHDVALAMQARAWQVSAVSMLPVGESFADLPAMGISTASLQMRPGAPDPRAIMRLRALLLQVQPDILHAHLVHANLLSRLVRLVHPRQIVVNTMHSQNQGGPWRTLAYRLTDRLAACTTTVSQGALDEAVRLRLAPESHLRLVYNGIDTSAHARDDQLRRRARRDLGVGDGFVWLAAGRLVEAKDYANMLAAFGRIGHGHRAPVRLLIAGDGPEAPALRATLARNGLSERVKLLGMRRDVPALMQAADAFVMSSAWEGLPMVLLEAGASALPSVVTDVGGSREAVEDGLTGYIVPPGDATALAEAMDRVMRSTADERRAMGEAARAHIGRHFDLGSVADQWDALYRALIQRAAR
jgi:glycosyltransferase involved in cell wall biosynthesis